MLTMLTSGFVKRSVNWLGYARNNGCESFEPNPTKGPSEMFAKIFSQIFDSSIVENPETRFTFIDFLVLADCNGVVDMTHDAIARRTNRPLALIRKTIAELEGPDPASRTPDFNGARIKRLDEHRDWGWYIINYGYFRQIAREEQRRQKTLDRVHKFRGKKEKVAGSNAVKRSVTSCNDFPSAYASTSPSEKEEEDHKEKRKPKNEQAVIDYCLKLGLPEADGRYYWDKWQAGGYVNAGKAIRDWQALIRSHKSAGYCPSQKQKPSGSFQKQPSPQQTKHDLEYEKWMQQRREKKS